MRNQKGITLIALVITIIVLLILAGVSISMVIGENGILTQADTATAETRKAAAKEEVELAWASADADYWNDWANNSSLKKTDYYNADNLNKYLEGKGTVTSVKYDEATGTYTVLYKSESYNMTYTMIIDGDGKVQSLSEYDCKEYVAWVNTNNNTYYFERQSEDENSADYYVWKSNNVGVDSEQAISYFAATVEQETSYSFDWSISSEETNDYAILLFVDANGTQTILANGISGTQSKTETVTLTPGNNMIAIGYTKNSSVNEGDDCVTITLKDIEAPIHSYDEGKLTKEHTCTEYGEVTYTCINCEKTKIEFIYKKHIDNNNDTICDICNDQIAGLYDENDVMLASWDELVNVYNYDVTQSERDGIVSGPLYKIIKNNNLTNAKKIVIPDFVDTIGENNFRLCSLYFNSIIVDKDNLSYDSREDCNAIIETATNTLILGCENTIIPNDITSIGRSAFNNCTNLTSIDIPDGVTNIGNSAFYFCTKLTSIDIPDGVTNIGNNAFGSCYKLTSITIPSSVKNIGESAFVRSGLKSATVGAENIGETAFYLCSSLKNITLLDTVKSIGENAFMRSGITSLTIPSSVNNIDDSICYECKSLSSVIINSEITGNSTFYNCTSLSSAIINSENVDETTFYNCTGLRKVTFGNLVKNIGDAAFYKCSALSTVYFQGTEEEWNNITIGSSNTYLTSANIIYNDTE